MGEHTAPIVERLLQIRGTQFTPIENMIVTEAAGTITELLEALEAALLVHGDGYSWGPQARAAITKATGAA